MNEASGNALINSDAAVLGLLAVILGFVFWGASRERGFWKKFYAVVPAILPCYLLPAIANSTGLVDGAGSGLYPMARDYLLPASLVLFCVFVFYGFSGYGIYLWRRAKGLQTSVISTSTDEPDERGLHN